MNDSHLSTEVHEKKPKNFSPQVEVSACYIELDGKLLLLQRTGKQEAGKWGVPGGKIEKKEDPLHAAIRELKEETGISVELTQTQFAGTLYLRKPEVDFVYHLFKIHLREHPNILLSDEHQSYHWASAKDLKTLPLMSGALEILRFYRKALVSNTHFFMQDLRFLGDEKQALAHKQYHKSKRLHLGVSMPKCNKLVKTYSQNLDESHLFPFVKKLWETNIFDSMMCATKILELPCIKPSRALWEIICQFLQQVDGWALEDSLAHAAWKCLLTDEKLLDEVEQWTNHPNLWMRRAALVYTLPFAKSGENPERMLRWASFYATDSEWFIQKAIGWWLRVLGEQQPKLVTQFLQTHGDKLKGVAKKEATRKLKESILC